MLIERSNTLLLTSMTQYKQKRADASQGGIAYLQRAAAVPGSRAPLPEDTRAPAPASVPQSRCVQKKRGGGGLRLEQNDFGQRTNVVDGRVRLTQTLARPCSPSATNSEQSRPVTNPRPSEPCPTAGHKRLKARCSSAQAASSAAVGQLKPYLTSTAAGGNIAVWHTMLEESDTRSARRGMTSERPTGSMIPTPNA